MTKLQKTQLENKGLRTIINFLSSDTLEQILEDLQKYAANPYAGRAIEILNGRLKTLNKLEKEVKEEIKPKKRVDGTIKVKCIRCGRDFFQTDYAHLCDAIMRAAGPRCERCLKRIKEERKKK